MDKMPDAYGGQIKVTVPVKKLFMAHINAIGLILAECPAGMGPLDLAVRAWMGHAGNVKLRRLDPKSGTDSTWAHKRMTNTPYVVLAEIFGMIEQTARLVMRILGSGGHLQMRCIGRWIETESAKDLIHPWVRDFIRNAPMTIVHSLHTICAVAADETIRVQAKLETMKKTYSFNPYQMWIYVDLVFQRAHDQQCSWLMMVEDGQLLAEVKATPKLPNYKISSITNFVDKNELLKDSKTFREAQSDNGQSGLVAAFNNYANKSQKQNASILQAIANGRARGGGGGGGGGKPTRTDQKKKAKPDGGERPTAKQAKEQLLAHCKKHNSQVTEARLKDICVWFALNECGNAKTAEGGCKFQTRTRGSKKKTWIVKKHICLCGDDHALVSCETWWDKN
jgi:hypothetical protein